MDDDCFPHDFIHGETVCQKHLKGIAVISQKRQQIARMVGMGAAFGVIMRLGFRKILRRIADASAVNMKGKKLIFADALRGGQSGDLRGNQHADGGLKKRNAARNHRKFRPSSDPRVGRGLPPKRLREIRKRIKKILRFVRPLPAIIL